MSMMRDLALAVALLSAGPASAHDWYSGLTRPDTGGSCCSGQDCRPVDTCSVPGHAWGGVVLDGKCVPVPPEKILDMPSPDGRAHACWRPNIPTLANPGARPFLMCVILSGDS